MSSTLLSAHQISRRHGAHAVLEDVEVRIGEGERIALVGPNGGGKSTLLRILAGEEAPDAGTVGRLGTVAHLPQLAGGPAGGTPAGSPAGGAPASSSSGRAVVLERVGVAAAGREVERLEGALAAGDLAAIEPHGAALERWLALGGADVEARIAAAAEAIGLDPELLDRPLASLSGGQASRVGLIAVAVARCDVLLLDEPTNHLDDAGLAALAALLAEHRGAAMVVSHDRAMLGAFASVVIELDGGRATRHGGGWAAYEAERAAARALAIRRHEGAVAERERLAGVDREIRRRAAASASRVSSRAAPDGDKHGREWVRMRADGMRQRAARLGTRRERVEVPDRPRERPALALDLSPGERRGGAAVALEGAELRRGAWRLGPLDLALDYGDRVLLEGPNGAGKSSLLAALGGDLPLAAGHRVLARGAVVATLGQDRWGIAGGGAGATAARGPGRDAAEGTTVAVLREATGLDETAARTALAAFGLGAEPAERPAATLSPGERTRAELALLAHRRATCLLLDEPTNHLDVEALEVLEGALEDWPGALVVASHDRRFKAALRLEREVRLGV